MSSSPFNNGEGDIRLVQEDLRRDEAEEVDMEEEEGSPLGIHPPASERGTLADISTHPNPDQAIGSANNQASLEVVRDCDPKVTSI